MDVYFQRHPEIRSFRRRSSTMDFSSLTTRRSSLAPRRNEPSYIDNNKRRISLFDSKINGDLNRNFKTLIVQVSSSIYSIAFTEIKSFVFLHSSMIKLRKQ